jgi:esterase/lipase
MKKAVFLLHGWLSDCNDFKVLMPFLEKNYQHIEKIAYPGHGPQENYDQFEAMPTIRLVEETFLKLKKQYDEIDIIGFSMGGALASYLGSMYDVHKLVMIAPANRYLNFLVPFTKLKNQINKLYEYEKARFGKDNQTEAVVKQKFKDIFEDDKTSLQFVKDKYLKKYFHHAYQNFRNVIAYVNENVKEIKCPCFLAWGKIDQLVPELSVRELYKICTNENRQLKTYDDLCHLMVLSSDCRELCRDIENFLTDNGGYALE